MIALLSGMDSAQSYSKICWSESFYLPKMESLSELNLTEKIRIQIEKLLKKPTNSHPWTLPLNPLEFKNCTKVPIQLLFGKIC